MANTKITTNVIADGAITSAKLDTSGLAIPSTATATTQSAGDNSTKVATTAYVETAVSNLVSAAPAALDTLDELAAALGDDANFATTVTDSLALKAPLASPDFTGDVTFDTSTLVVDSTNNRVGIGIASPSHPLHVSGASGATQAFFNTTSGNTNFQIKVTEDAGTVLISKDNTAARSLSFQIGESNVPMTIDTSGNVLVGKTSADNGATVGIEMTATDKLYVTDSASSPLIANRLSSDGNVIVIQKDGTSVGSLGTLSWLIGQDSGDAFNSGALFRGQTTGAGYIQMKVGNTASGGILIGDTTDDFRGGLISYGTDHASLPNRTIIFANNTQVITALSSGNVGLGTNTPQRRLTVGDGSGSEIMSIYAGNTSSSALHFTDTNTTTDYQGFVTYNHVDEALRFGAAEEEGMRLTSTGLGIGTTSPQGTLHVKNTSDSATLTSVSDSIVLSHQSGSYTDGNYYGVLGFSKANSNGATLGAAIAPVMDGTGAGTDLTFSTALAAGSCFEKMRITNDGQIRSIRSNAGSESYINLELKNTATSAGLSLDCADGVNGKKYEVQSNPSGKFFVYDRTAEAHRFTIDTSGDVGIGTFTPSNKLHVKSGDNEGIFMEGTGGGHWFNFKSGTSQLWSMGAQSGLMGWYNRTTNTYKMVITDDGDVGVGTTSPDTKLDVQGAIQASESGGDFIRIQTDGNNNIFDINSGAYVFRTSGFAERARILATGGLTFNGDTAAANALDDYEEGEWTPTCSNVTLTASGGHYTKIGNRVWVTFYLQFPTTSNTNPVQINNLPFTVRNHDSGQARANGNRGGWTVGYSNSGQELRFTASSGTTTVTAYNFDGNTVNNNNVSAKSIYGGGYYEVA